jgi:hypothetical protein
VAGAGALIALAVAAPAASAYISSGDIHLSTSHGSRQYRVTNSGGYGDVSPTTGR